MDDKKKIIEEATGEEATKEMLKEFDGNKGDDDE